MGTRTTESLNHPRNYHPRGFIDFTGSKECILPPSLRFWGALKAWKTSNSSSCDYFWILGCKRSWHANSLCEKSRMVGNMFSIQKGLNTSSNVQKTSKSTVIVIFSKKYYCRLTRRERKNTRWIHCTSIGKSRIDHGTRSGSFLHDSNSIGTLWNLWICVYYFIFCT